MTDSVNLEMLSTRSGFNSAVRHIKQTMEIAGDGGNLGDIVYELDDDELTSNKIGLLLRMLLVDKMGYKTASINLHDTVKDLPGLSKEFSKWNGIDLVAAYYHPELGLLIANPKVAEELAGFGDLRKRELLVIYAGLQGKETDENCQKAAELALRLFEGSKVTPPASISKGKFTATKVAKPKKAAEPKPVKAKASASKGKTSAKGKSAAAPTKKPAAVQSSGGGPKKMTPRYAIVVQNELFHNGNVEAWKRIVASYKAKHPNLEVYIYYENERILDINSLFKWGKVKHGTAIEIAVAGDEIQDVAKLQRYLAQGASQMFEAFLRGPVNSVLKLF
ncbi:MAG: hypothetical protein FWC01_05335 [Treponema sp.]|nr:hypothetical protein [Treponema sp.]MCL2237445.1 hypothetical protein [Treponema sp.]